MPVRYQCPECGNEVLVPERASAFIGPSEQMGCLNPTAHDAPAVMQEADDGT